MTSMQILWIIALATIAGFIPDAPTLVQSQMSLLNTPPVIYVDRNWRMFEDEEVGSMIARVQASDAENDALEFDLEPQDLMYGESKQKLPFRIDSRTGNVYLNDSIEGRGGERFFLYVTVSDGKLTAKTEVFVNIFAKNDTSIYNSRTPSFTQKTKNIFPPYHLLPVVHQLQQQQQQTNQHNQLPSYATFNNRHHPYLNRTKSELNIGDEGDTNEDDTELKTILTPVKTNTTKSNSTAIHQSRTPASTPIPPQTQTESTYPLKAVIPVIITVCGIFLAAGVIALFIYRKHLCAIGRSLKKKSKEEMAKKSNQSNISSNITEDSRNSMVLQHWNGPMAFSNRYVPWERENQPHGVLATSQLSTSSSTGGAGGAPGVGGNSQQISKTDRWEFPRHRLKFFNILGEGAFGQV